MHGRPSKSRQACKEGRLLAKEARLLIKEARLPAKEARLLIKEAGVDCGLNYGNIGPRSLGGRLSTNRDDDAARGVTGNENYLTFTDRFHRRPRNSLLIGLSRATTPIGV